MHPHHTGVKSVLHRYGRCGVAVLPTHEMVRFGLFELDLKPRN